MKRAVKFALAAGVLLLGTTVALVCPRSPTSTARPAASHQPALRPWTSARRQPAPSAPVRPRPTEASRVELPRAMIRASIEKSDPPPKLSREYPRAEDPPLECWAEAVDYRLPQPADSKPATRIHKVADGDTLELLAERYLGGADRAAEILDLNHDVLGTAGALPIGVELRIPPRSAPAAEQGEMLPERPLVPIRP